MANLYEIKLALATYEMEFDPETGEWINEDELDALNMERDEKIENILLWVKNLKADAKAIKDEEDALKARRKALENKAEHLMDYVALGLDGEKFSTPRVAVQWRKTESVEILDEAAVPDEFLKVAKTPMKDNIKKYLKAHEGEEVSWATLRHRNSMSIK